MKRRPAPLEQAALLEYAVRALTRKALSVGELRMRLRARAVIPEDVDRVITSLKEAGALDDSRLAESFATSRLEGEGVGSMRVVRDLRARRVAPSVAEQAVQTTYRDVNEGELIEQFLARKFRHKDLRTWLADEKNLASAFRRLRYAGFSSGASIAALKRHANRSEDIEIADDECEGDDRP